MKNDQEIVLYTEEADPPEKQREGCHGDKNSPPISLIHGIIGTLVKSDRIIRHGLASEDQK
jgi:hypothetical protein